MSIIYKRLRNELKNTPLAHMKRWWDRSYRRPVFNQSWFPPKCPSFTRTLLICVEREFDQNVKNAGYLTPLGFAQGWSEVAGGAKFIFVKDLFKELDLYENPVVFVSQHSLRHFTLQEARKLRGRNIFVWVGIHPRSSRGFEKQNPLSKTDELDLYHEAYSRLILVEPKFVWNSFGKAAEELCQVWRDDGFRFETIFPGANTQLYFPEPSVRFQNVSIGYVGGYWEEKAQAFDSYLRPLEDIFVPYGYSWWPYKNYSGGLSEDDERRLYSSAGLIPLIHGPAGWKMAEITERYLKAPACRAFCIADENSAVREIFDEHEMLQATTSEHFHSLVDEFLHGKIDVERWKESGYRAILKKHLVKHRAIQILRALED